MRGLFVPGMVLLGAVVVLGGLGYAGYEAYRLLNRPTLAGLGGTLLVYEVDRAALPDQALPIDYRPAQMADSLQRRLDPVHRLGVTVEALSPLQFQIVLPRGADHDADLARIKQQMALAGKLEFRILANLHDDQAAIEAAQATFDRDAWPDEERAAREKDLANRASLGQPPPAPQPEKGETFEWHNGQTGTRAQWGEAHYEWVELGPSERKSLHLALDQAGDPYGEEAATARSSGKPLLLYERLGGTLLFTRDCVAEGLTAEERADRRWDCFLLTRCLPPGQTVTGLDLDEVRPGRDAEDRPTILFALTAVGGQRFHALTSANAPSGSPAFHRHLAILLDDRIISAPTLNEPIGKRGQISGDFTVEAVSQYVQVMQAGMSPVPLKPVPVSEIAVGPRQ